MAKSKAPNANKNAGFDDVLAGLRQVVEQLEAGNVGLEDALSAYEKGVTLAKDGHALLDKAEKRIEVLVSDGPNGLTTEELEPLEEDS